MGTPLHLGLCGHRSRTHHSACLNPSGGVLVVSFRSRADCVWSLVYPLLLGGGKKMKIYIWKLPRFLSRLIMRFGIHE